MRVFALVYLVAILGFHKVQCDELSMDREDGQSSPLEGTSQGNDYGPLVPQPENQDVGQEENEESERCPDSENERASSKQDGLVLDLAKPDENIVRGQLDETNGITHTTYTPKSCYITSVVDGQTPIWTASGDERCLLAKVLSKGGYSALVLFLEKSDKYFEKNGEKWKSIEKTEFDQKLKDMEEMNKSERESATSVVTSPEPTEPKEEAFPAKPVESPALQSEAQSFNLPQLPLQHLTPEPTHPESSLVSKVDSTLFNVEEAEEENVKVLKLTPKNDKVTELKYDKKQIWSGSAFIGTSSNLVEALIYFNEGIPELATIQTIKGSNTSTVYRYHDGSKWQNGNEKDHENRLEGLKEDCKPIGKPEENPPVPSNPLEQNTLNISSLDSYRCQSFEYIYDDNHIKLIVPNKDISISKLLNGTEEIYTLPTGEILDHTKVYLNQYNDPGLILVASTVSSNTQYNYFVKNGTKWERAVEYVEKMKAIKIVSSSKTDTPIDLAKTEDTDKCRVVNVELLNVPTRFHLPNPECHSNNVRSGNKNIWTATGDERCKSCAIYSKNGVSLLSLFIRDGNELHHKYFEKSGKEWKDLTHEVFFKKYKNMQVTTNNSSDDNSDQPTISTPTEPEEVNKEIVVETPAESSPSPEDNEEEAQELDISTNQNTAPTEEPLLVELDHNEQTATKREDTEQTTVSANEPQNQQTTEVNELQESEPSQPTESPQEVTSQHSEESGEILSKPFDPNTLDLSSPDESKVDVKNNDDGINSKRYFPKKDVKVTSVVDGELPIWTASEKDHFLSAEVSSKGESSLVMVYFASGWDLNRNYFEKNNGGWTSIDENTHKSKLNDLKNGVTSQSAKDAPKEEPTEPKKVSTETPQDVSTPVSQSTEQVVTNPLSLGSSSRRGSTTNTTSTQGLDSDTKAYLDRYNDKLYGSFEYHHDGLHTKLIVPHDGVVVTQLLESESMIWTGQPGETFGYAKAYLNKDGAPELVLVAKRDNSGTKYTYYSRSKVLVWSECDNFGDKMDNLRAPVKATETFVLDVSVSQSVPECSIIKTRLFGVQTKLHFTNPGHLAKEVVNGKETIWKGSRDDKCSACYLYLKDNEPLLVFLVIESNGGKVSKYLERNEEWKGIEKTPFNEKLDELRAVDPEVPQDNTEDQSESPKTHSEEELETGESTSQSEELPESAESPTEVKTVEQKEEDTSVVEPQPDTDTNGESTPIEDYDTQREAMKSISNERSLGQESHSLGTPDLRGSRTSISSGIQNRRDSTASTISTTSTASTLSLNQTGRSTTLKLTRPDDSIYQSFEYYHDDNRIKLVLPQEDVTVTKISENRSVWTGKPGETLEYAKVYLDKDGKLQFVRVWKRDSSGVKCVNYTRGMVYGWSKYTGNINDKINPLKIATEYKGDSIMDLQNEEDTDDCRIFSVNFLGVPTRSYSPKPGYYATEVKDGEVSIWKASEGTDERCLSCEVYTKYEQRILSLTKKRDGKRDDASFEFSDGEWKSMTEEEFNRKFKAMVDGPSQEPEISENESLPSGKVEDADLTVTSNDPVNVGKVEDNESEAPEPSPILDTEQSAASTDLGSLDSEPSDQGAQSGETNQQESYDTQTSSRPVNNPEDQDPMTNNSEGNDTIDTDSSITPDDTANETSEGEVELEKKEDGESREQISTAEDLFQNSESNMPSDNAALDETNSESSISSDSNPADSTKLDENKDSSESDGSSNEVFTGFSDTVNKMMKEATKETPDVTSRIVEDNNTTGVSNSTLSIQEDKEQSSTSDTQSNEHSVSEPQNGSTVESMNSFESSEPDDELKGEEELPEASESFPVTMSNIKNLPYIGSKLSSVYNFGKKMISHGTKNEFNSSTKSSKPNKTQNIFSRLSRGTCNPGKN
ncbi:hypothetical protein BEWA_047150 [Theileria equi strain WA]|uniref:Signal peptide containing protein n=1 Tax=Theileria equi strain WA TaxID=1537102 RepID=L1L9T9_THEEQ|nr:hypothetical protein BEWA_047150 [Theileria equi strain WA]EKX72251.1 hypothetical protein BEWA_047150 [Theileria equi strain WA]|eukprot:XP_004831703.1 hypothetical protein BEWA_047150 [Theileria equi strain WA]